MHRIFVRVVADGFPQLLVDQQVSNITTTNNNNNNIVNNNQMISSSNPSAISFLLLERNQFYKKLSGVNRTNDDSTIKLLDRNFCCILPQNSSLSDIKQTICRQYQSIFYEKIPDSNEFTDNSDVFTLSRLYSDLGLELGLWNTQLKARDIFNDEQVVFARLDCSRKSGIKLKDKYQQMEQQSLSPDSNKEQEQPNLFETPKKRKLTTTSDKFSTPQSKKTKVATPISVSNSVEDSDSSVSNTEDETEFVSRPIRKTRNTTRNLKQKTLGKVTKKARDPIVIQSDEESEGEKEEEEQETPEKQQEKEESEKEAETEEDAESEKEEETEEDAETEKEDEEVEEEEEESEKERETMTKEQYAKFFANTKIWLKKVFAGGRFRSESDQEDMFKAFSQLTDAHQKELLELMKTMKSE